MLPPGAYSRADWPLISCVSFLDVNKQPVGAGSSLLAEPVQFRQQPAGWGSARRGRNEDERSVSFKRLQRGWEAGEGMKAAIGVAASFDKRALPCSVVSNIHGDLGQLGTDGGVAAPQAHCSSDQIDARLTQAKLLRDLELQRIDQSCILCSPPICHRFLHFRAQPQLILSFEHGSNTLWSDLCQCTPC